MTDKEIIKALECCITKKNCTENCPYIDLKPNYFYCIEKSTLDALDLINRQQEQIKRQANNIHALLKMDDIEVRRIKKDAIKEFARKLKEEHSTPDILMPFNWISIEDTALDQLVAEMVGAEE